MIFSSPPPLTGREAPRRAGMPDMKVLQNDDLDVRVMDLRCVANGLIDREMRVWGDVRVVGKLFDGT